MRRQQAKQRDEVATENMFEFQETTVTDYKKERRRLKDKLQHNETQDAAFNPVVLLHRLDVISRISRISRFFSREMEESYEERLLEEIRKHRNLYDTSMREYKDVQRTKNAWDEVAAAVGVDVAACKLKWKYLRDKFVRAKKKLKGKSGDGASGGVPAIIYILSWLDSFIKCRDTETNMPADFSCGSGDVLSPACGVASPACGVASPTRGVPSPARGVPSPSPARGVPSPARGVPSPSPACGVASPTRGVPSPSPARGVPSPSPARGVPSPACASNSSSNHCSPSTSSPCSSNLTVPPTVQPAPSSEITAPPAPRQSSAPGTNTAKQGRKRRWTETAETALMQRLEALDQRRDDEDARFSTTIADILRRIPTEYKTQARLWLYEFTYNLEQEYAHQPTYRLEQL